MNNPYPPAPNNRPIANKNQNSRLRRRQNAIAAVAITVAEQLGEPNIAAIARLIEIFGEELVQGLATNAVELFEAARTGGPDAYKVSPEGSSVATNNGEPRSCGGVFFYLAREHARKLNLDWYGLRVPSPPRTDAPVATTPQQVTPTAPPKIELPEPKAVPAPATTPAPVATPANTVPTAAKPQPTGEAPAPKPNRIKSTVVGTPVGPAKASDQPGVLQLVFEVEMTPTMPKGLPTLGRSRVIVLCNEKQYRQAVPNGGVPGRMIVEGEVAPTLSTAGKPLLVLVCTRITTPEAEQAKRATPG